MACGDSGGGETSEGVDKTTGDAQMTTGSLPTTGTPTTGTPASTSTSSASEALTGSTTGDVLTGTSTGDVLTGTSTGDVLTGTSTGVSSSTGPGAACGDGAIDQDETCDDAGESNTCNADCTAAACGDSKVNATAGETCDDGGESKECNADCTAAACGDSKLNVQAGEACDGEAPANATCDDQCAVACDVTHDDCNMDLGDGCEVDVATDNKNCGMCGKACANNIACKAGKCVDVGDAFNSYPSEGRTVYLFKTTKCADLNQHTTFCEDKGLAWWKAKSQPDAQLLITNAFNLDNFHTWIQVWNAKTTLGTVDGFNVIVDSPGCVDASADGWTAFRKWGCSFCEPSVNQTQSCCWDKDHAYDWFVCED